MSQLTSRRRVAVAETVGEKGEQSRSVAIVSILGVATLLTVVIGVLALYEFSLNYVMPLKYWCILITSQFVLGVLVFLCYYMFYPPFIPGGAKHTTFVHPYTTHAMNNIFVSATQTCMAWMIYGTTERMDQLHYFDNYRYSTLKPANYDSNFTLVWIVLMGYCIIMVPAAGVKLFRTFKFS